MEGAADGDAALAGDPLPGSVRCGTRALTTRALVVGASGLVGGALMRTLGVGATGTYLTRAQTGLIPLDARDEDSVRRVLEEVDPDVVFVPAAEANVDWCEANPEEARERNVAPVRVVIAAAGPRRIVGFSSDYVFDGEGGPYTEDAARGPLSVYGRLKVELEDLLLAADQTVARTTTVFGLEPPPGKNFVLRLIASLNRGEHVRVVSDQISTPTYADDLARAAARVAGMGGVWHLAGPTLMGRAELADAVARVFGCDLSLILPVTTNDLRQPAARPRHGGLIPARYRARFGTDPVRSPEDGLRAVKELLPAPR